MVYTVYFTTVGGSSRSEFSQQHTSKAKADAHVKYLFAQDDILLVTVDITRKAPKA